MYLNELIGLFDIIIYCKIMLLAAVCFKGISDNPIEPRSNPETGNGLQYPSRLASLIMSRPASFGSRSCAQLLRSGAQCFALTKEIILIWRFSADFIVSDAR